MDLTQVLPLAAPELLIAIGALVVLMVGAFGGERSTGLVSLLCGLILVGASYLAVQAPHGMAFNGAFIGDPLAVFGKVAVYLTSAVAISLGYGWLHRNNLKRFEYPVLILLAALGMSMMCSSGDLISLYVGIELHSLALYVLAAFHRDDARSSEAGLKYFVLGALSSGLLLYGASLVYGFTGSMRFDAIAAATVEAAGTTGNTGLLFGLVFMLCGLAFKVSAAPFHMWTPDVYEGAPTPSVMLFTTAPKMAAMVLIARVLYGAFGDALEQWRQVVVVISLLCFAVGAFGGLMQKDIKRLLAYSSIANIGYALLALAAGTPQGLQAMLVFMVLYMVDVTGIFAILLGLSRAGRPITRVEDLAGLWKEKPFYALALTILSLSLLGMPPLSGFWAKFFVFGAAIPAGLWVFAALGLVASVAAGFYYLRMVKVMWFDPAPGPADRSPRDTRWVALAATAFSFPVVLLLLGALSTAAGHAAGLY
jgi:NADH-quinone oxidoreductase subunit N